MKKKTLKQKAEDWAMRNIEQYAEPETGGYYITDYEKAWLAGYRAGHRETKYVKCIWCELYGKPKRVKPKSVHGYFKREDLK